jgi:hypothetical protein
VLAPQKLTPLPTLVIGIDTAIVVVACVNKVFPSCLQNYGLNYCESSTHSMTHKIPCFEKNIFPTYAVQLLYWHALTWLPIIRPSKLWFEYTKLRARRLFYIKLVLISKVFPS